MRELEALLGIVEVDMYNKNLFRLSGSLVTTAPRQIERRLKRIDNFKKYGGNLGSLTVLPPMDTFPDTENIRLANQKLNDPERRAIDELFWIWPTDNGETDEATQALQQRQYQSAKDIWRQSRNKDIAIHNQAVLALFEALEWEQKHKQSPLTSEEDQSRLTCWRRCFGLWGQVLQNGAFWRKFQARLKALKDPRLTTGFQRAVERTLPLALLLLHIRLAIEAVEKGHPDKAIGHRALLLEAPFDAHYLDEAIRKGIHPIRNRLKLLTENAEKQSSESPKKGEQIFQKLLDDSRQPLLILDSILTEDHHNRVSAHDNLALSLLQISINFGNDTNNWKAVVQMMETTKSMAVSESSLGRIESNRRIVQDNYEQGVCFFCGENMKSESASIKKAMHGDINYEKEWDRFHLYSQTFRTWKYRQIIIPRCASCHKRHRKYQNYEPTFGYGFSTVIAILTIILIVNFSNLWILWMILGLVLINRSFYQSDVIFEKRILGGIKKESQQDDYPEIQELLNKGWTWGEKPADANT